MRHPFAWLLPISLAACSEPPATIAVGRTDTVVVNSRQPVQLKAHLLTASGDTGESAAPARFTRVGGGHVAITDDGTIVCDRAADVAVEVARAGLTRRFTLRCLPVRGFAFHGAPPLVANGPMENLPLTPIGLDGNPVPQLAALVSVRDSTVVTLHRGRLQPRSAGQTVVEVDIGECALRLFLDVAGHASDTRDIAPFEVFADSSLRMKPGELRRWPVPPGLYELRLSQSPTEIPSLVLAGEGLRCYAFPGSVGQHYSCSAGEDASVVVRRPVGMGQAGAGSLIIRRGGLRQRSAPPTPKPPCTIEMPAPSRTGA